MPPHPSVSGDQNQAEQKRGRRHLVPGELIVAELSPEQRDAFVWAGYRSQPDAYERVVVPASQLEAVLATVATPDLLNAYWKGWKPMSAAYFRQLEADVWTGLFKQLFEPLAERKFERVLEVGCGWTPIGRYFPIQPTFADLNVQMCASLRDVAGARVKDNECNEPESLTTRVICTAYHPLAVRDASYDVVLACNTLDMTNHPDAALAEFKRVLRPGGVAIFVQDVLPSAFATLLRSYMHNRKDVAVIREKVRSSVSLSNGVDDTFIRENHVIGIEVDVAGVTFDGKALGDQPLLIDSRSHLQGDLMAQALIQGFSINYRGTVFATGLFPWTEETLLFRDLRNALHEIPAGVLPEYNHQRVIADLLVIEKKGKAENTQKKNESET